MLKAQRPIALLASMFRSLPVLMLSLIISITPIYAQTAQPKPHSVKECPVDMEQLHFDALILKGEKTQKAWYVHNNEILPGKACVVINGWSRVGPTGWKAMKGLHQFILTVSIDGSIQKLIGDSKTGQRMYVIDIPADHQGLSWVCNHSGHHIHSGGSVSSDGKIIHDGVMKASSR